MRSMSDMLLSECTLIENIPKTLKVVKESLETLKSVGEHIYQFLMLQILTYLWYDIGKIKRNEIEQHCCTVSIAIQKKAVRTLQGLT